ncbi:lipocalin-like domain-containing protein [Calditerrivibrio sp.]|uniref:lipocalin-like domain-containing protein n=1 Tax=Calditerrivibrio sp. TaxID=2792612 RepID=UPI003D0ED8AF
MRYIIILFLFFCTLVYGEDFRKLNRNDQVSLPQDLYYRGDYKSQWWYFTGHLTATGGKKYGFEFTIFVVNLNKIDYKSKFGLNRIYISHLAITDIDNKKYYFEDDTSRGAHNEAFADSGRLFVKVFDDSISGGIEKFFLKGKGANFSFELELIPIKKPIINGLNGYSNKIYGCEECASLYFSITRLKTKGIVELNGKKDNVAGESWFDREINSDYKTDKLKGWDWFSLMLDDGTELIVYRIKNRNGNVDKSSYAAFIDNYGGKVNIDFKDINIKPLDFYISKKTGAKYPIKWEMVISNKKIYVQSMVEDQEFVASKSTFNYYYEGACRVYGDLTGKGYMELTGY